MLAPQILAATDHDLSSVCPSSVCPRNRSAARTLAYQPASSARYSRRIPFWEAPTPAQGRRRRRAVRFGMLSKERVSAEARPGLAGFQHPIDRRPADLDCLCDLRRPQPLRLHCAHLSNDYRDRPASAESILSRIWSYRTASGPPASAASGAGPPRVARGPSRRAQRRGRPSSPSRRRPANVSVYSNPAPAWSRNRSART
jgi:hypothetical protein